MHISFCVTQTLLKLSKTSSKLVKAEDLEIMRKTHNRILQNLVIRDGKTASVRTTNPIVMVMSDPAIRILIAMCELGRSCVSEADADHLDARLPVEPSSDTNASDDNDSAASASVTATHSSDGSADVSIAYTRDSSIKAAALAARAFAEIAEDTWCRVRLVEVCVVIRSDIIQTRRTPLQSHFCAFTGGRSTCIGVFVALRERLVAERKRSSGHESEQLPAPIKVRPSAKDFHQSGVFVR